MRQGKLTPFYATGRGKKLLPMKELKLKVGHQEGFDLQYPKVYDLIQSLQRWYEMFTPLTLFETFAVNIKDQKHLLAKLYKWMLIKDAYVKKLKWNGKRNLMLDIQHLNGNNWTRLINHFQLILTFEKVGIKCDINGIQCQTDYPKCSVHCQINAGDVTNWL